MARQPRTPGATEPKTTETEVVTPTTAANADAALDAILGEPETKTPEPTSTVSEPVAIEPTAEELAERKEYEEFQAWRKNKDQDAAKSVEPVTPHVPTFDATTPKRTRQVFSKDGWTTEEY
ncbi:hypothetical protein [Acinetobacter bohemicus]|uniref:hypothetical protein n=1 Tax=Acinetobacter bohemicus TaxID=1435036 RepID=UPI003FA1F6D6